MAYAFLYDGTFEGFLSAVFEAYAKKLDVACICTAEEYQPALFIEVRTITTAPEKAARVEAGIRKKMGRLALEYIYTAFLAPDTGRETQLLHYIRLGLCIGRAVVEHYEHPAVMAVTKLNVKVNRELQWLRGFVRFGKTGDAYVAVIEPECDILALLAPHFAERFGDQRFAICDKRRKKTAVSAAGQWFMVNDVVDEASHTEDMARLFSAFIRSLSIKERENPALQRKMMPVRYWKHMPEHQETYARLTGQPGWETLPPADPTP